MVESIESEELLEIVKSPPSLPIRIGSFIVSAVILFFLLASAFVKFPDDQLVKLNMQSDSPVSRIFTSKAVYIDSILVENQTYVEEGQTLLLFSGKIPWSHLNVLQRSLNTMIYNDTFWFSDLQYERFQDLPELSDQLIELESVVSRIQLLIKKQSLYKSEVFRSQKRSELINRIGLAEDRLAVNKKKWVIQNQLFIYDSLLFADSVISKSEYFGSRTKHLDLSDHLIALKREVSSLRSSLIEHDQQTQNRFLDLDTDLLHAKLEARNTIKRALTSIESYKINNSVRSLHSGLMRQDLPFEKGMYIPENTQLFSIQSQNNSFFAIAEVESANSGKLKTGQKAFIEFDAYPFAHYGFVEGSIQDFNPVIKEGKYTLRISLPNQLVTDRGIQLTYLPEMTGTARIICEEQTLLDKLMAKAIRKVKVQN